MKKEIEARFLDIDADDLLKRLADAGAVDEGEKLLSEVIFYDRANTWPAENRFVRIRSVDDDIELTYKHHKAHAIDGASEIEFRVPDAALAEQFLEAVGLVASRHQEKKRHTLRLDGVTVDIDTWPQVPTYVELEGESEEAVRRTAELLGFDWSDAVFENARDVIHGRYSIPVGELKWFTFDRVE